MDKYLDGSAYVVFTHGLTTYALSSLSGKTLDTLWALDTQTGQENKIQLRTLAKNSASKLPEVRTNFAWFVSSRTD